MYLFYIGETNRYFIYGKEYFLITLEYGCIGVGEDGKLSSTNINLFVDKVKIRELNIQNLLDVVS